MTVFTRHFSNWPKKLPRHLTVPATSLVANLDISARRYPDKPAFVYYGATLAYAELKRQVDALAGYMQQRLGVTRGDRVLLFMQNCPQFIIACYAAWRCGAIAVPTNPMNVTAELRSKIVDATPKVAVVAQDLFAQIAPLLGPGGPVAIVTAYSEYLPAESKYPMPEFVSEPLRALPQATPWRAALDAELLPNAVTVDPREDLAIVLYTSGTTGEGKGCMHTHHSVMCTAVGSAVWSGLHTDSVVLCSVPLFHVTGLQHCMNNVVYAGATTVIMSRWDKQLALRLIADYRISHWTNIPTMVVDVLSAPEALRMDWSSMSFIGGGGASMPEAIAQRLLELTGLAYAEGFGSTESISQTHWNPTSGARKQCLGIPVFDTDSRVIDPETLRELGPGEVGEIISSGPQIMRGYWNKPEASAEAFIELDGKRFFRTGDLGRYDEDGYFYIVDRLKRMINAAGFKVWPAEVEAAMYAHPAVQEACIIAAPDERRGETVKAVIVLKPEHRASTKPEDIIAWSREQMSAYKVPRIVEFVEALPRSPAGKIQWRLLQEQEFSRA